jgi:DNA gyrase/topoisomerase IV subunit B
LQTNYIDLINIIGLQWGQKNNPDNLNVGKIVICTDADADGSAICGLLINFFNLFPELFEAGMVCRSISPIITAEKGSDLKKYYSLSDYKKEENSLKGYKITYLKGLGTQTDKLYKDMMQNPIFHYFTKDDIADLSLRSWFGKGNASERKAMLKEDVE